MASRKPEETHPESKSSPAAQTASKPAESKPSEPATPEPAVREPATPEPVAPKPVETSAKAQAMPTHLRAGKSDMASGLKMWGLEENKQVFTPSLEEMQSSAFKIIVGEGKFTSEGRPVSTIVDVIHTGGWTEIKLGTSPLNSSYQLRLQVYFAVKNSIPLTVATPRAINPSFGDYLTRWGVHVP
jgi:hypothetical protein